MSKKWWGWKSEKRQRKLQIAACESTLVWAIDQDKITPLDKRCLLFCREFGYPFSDMEKWKKGEWRPHEQYTAVPKTTGLYE